MTYHAAIYSGSGHYGALGGVQTHSPTYPVTPPFFRPMISVGHITIHRQREGRTIVFCSYGPPFRVRFFTRLRGVAMHGAHPKV